MLNIKVCGMTEMAQIHALGELGVNFIGFIFYEKSPRYVFHQLTEKEIRKKKNEIKVINGTFKKVGVFVNKNPQEIRHIVDECGLDFVQLHGNETPEYCNMLFAKVPIIKAFSIDEQSDIKSIIQPYQEFVDYFLFDAATKNYGGSGKKFNWKLLENQEINKPFFLSGGIIADDVEIIISLIKQNAMKGLFSLDINSKFEIEPGIKNIPVIQNFLQQINANRI